MAKLDFDTCMDILDWYDDDAFDYITHILLSKVDGEQRVKRALPEIRQRARKLLECNRGTEGAYPEALLNIPA